MPHLLAQIGAILLVVVVFALLVWQGVRSRRMPTDDELIQAWCRERELRFLRSKRYWSRIYPFSNPFALRSNVLDGVYYVVARDETGRQADFWACCRRSPFRNFVPELTVEPARGSIQA